MLLSGVLFSSQIEAQLPVFTDDYASGVSFAEFGGSTNLLTVVTDQKFAGTSSLKVDVPAAGYTGGALKAATTQNLTSFNALTFYCKASKAVTLNVSGIGNNGASNVFQAEYRDVAISTVWTKYIIPIPDASKLTAEDGLFHFAEGADEGAYSLWFDNIQYEIIFSGIGVPTASFASETLTKQVGENFSVSGTVAVYPVNSVNQTIYTAAPYFTFTSSNTAVATINSLAVGTAVSAGSATITGKLKSVTATGSIGVTVVAAADPTTAAPTPTRAAAGVISLYSEAYTNRPVDTWSAVWDQADVADVVIASNNNKKYTKLNYCGIEFTTNTIDATTMDYYHVDVWTPNASFFNVKLVDFGPNGTYAGGDDKESELPFTPALSGWVSLDIPLANFTGLTSRAHLAQMLFISSTSTVYIDNIYFYNSLLPVQLKSFKAAISGIQGLLKWSTVTETNNKGFSIERSLDNTNWKEIGFVKGAGNSSLQHDYTFSDITPANNLNYYRLKQIDLDGRITYSGVEKLNFENILTKGLQVYPNPASDYIILPIGTLTAAGRYDIISSNGAKVAGNTINTNNSNSNLKITISNLANGIYYLQYFDGQKSTVSRFSVIH